MAAVDRLPLPYVCQSDADTVRLADFERLYDPVRKALKAAWETIDKMQIDIDSKSPEFDYWKKRITPIKQGLAEHSKTLEQLLAKAEKIIGAHDKLKGIELVQPLLLKVHLMSEQVRKLEEILECTFLETATKTHNEMARKCDEYLKENRDPTCALKKLIPMFESSKDKSSAKDKIKNEREKLLANTYDSQLVASVKHLHIDLIEYIQVRVELLAKQIPLDQENPQEQLLRVRDSIKALKDECTREGAYPKPKAAPLKVRPPLIPNIPIEGLDAKVQAYIKTFNPDKVILGDELNFRQANFMKRVLVTISHWGIRKIVDQMEDVARGFQKVNEDLMTRLDCIFRANLTPREECKTLIEEVCFYKETLGALTATLSGLEKEIRHYTVDKEVHLGVNYAEGLRKYSERISRVLDDTFARLLQPKYFDIFETEHKLFTYIRSIPKEPTTDLLVAVTEIRHLYTVAVANRVLKPTEKFLAGDFIPTFRNTSLATLENCIANLAGRSVARIKPKDDVLERISKQKPLNEFEGARAGEAAAPLPLEIIHAVIWQIVQGRLYPKQALDPYLPLAITALQTNPAYRAAYEKTCQADPAFKDMIENNLGVIRPGDDLSAMTEIIGNIDGCAEKALIDGAVKYSRIYNYAKSYQLLEYLDNEEKAKSFKGILDTTRTKIDQACIQNEFPSHLPLDQYGLKKGGLGDCLEDPTSFCSLLITLLSKALWSMNPKDQNEKKEALVLLKAFYGNQKPKKNDEDFKMPEPGLLKYLMGVLLIQDVLAHIKEIVEIAAHNKEIAAQNKKPIAYKKRDASAYEEYLLRSTLIRYIEERPENEDWTEHLRELFTYRKMEYVLFVLLREDSIIPEPMLPQTSVKLKKALAIRGHSGRSIWMEGMEINAALIELPPAKQEAERPNAIKKLKSLLDRPWSSDDLAPVRERLDDKYLESIVGCIKDLEANR